MKELVLPSGRFARIRPMVWGDFIAAMGQGELMSTVLITRCVTIDDQQLTVEELLAADPREIFPIHRIVSEDLGAIVASPQKGIA
jgi:hypothetical protein